MAREVISMKTPNMIDAKRRNKDKVNYIEYDVDLKFGEGKTFFVRTYGCQMNEHDSEKIRGMLRECGFSEAESYEDADVVILNTLLFFTATRASAAIAAAR